MVMTVQAPMQIRSPGCSGTATPVPMSVPFTCVPFDEPDLSVWNYRQLKNTPIENTGMYKKHSKKMKKLAKRFSEKYQDE